MAKLTKYEYRLLKWAVKEAATWRGTYIGSTEGLSEFDAQVKDCKMVLKKIKPKKK